MTKPRERKTELSMAEPHKIHLSPQELEIIQTIIQAQALPRRCQLYVFGSRAQPNTPKPYADLDLLLKDNEEIKRQSLFDLEQAFEESDLPFRVDVVDWNRLPPSFRDAIRGTLKKLELDLSSP